MRCSKDVMEYGGVWISLKENSNTNDARCMTWWHTGIHLESTPRETKCVCEQLSFDYHGIVYPHANEKAGCLFVFFFFFSTGPDLAVHNCIAWDQKGRCGQERMAGGNFRCRNRCNRAESSKQRKEDGGASCSVVMETCKREK